MAKFVILLDKTKKCFRCEWGGGGFTIVLKLFCEMLVNINAGSRKINRK